MTITIDLTPELEHQIRMTAAQKGIGPDIFIAETMREQLKKKTTAQSLGSVSARETELILTINRSLSEITWTRYHELIAKRHEENLTADEQEELILLSDQIENANLSRIAAAAELAHLRHMSLEDMLYSLELKVRSNA